VKRVRTRLGAVITATSLGAVALVSMGGAAHALSNPSRPQLTPTQLISSHPFSGAPNNASDIEGLGYVPSDGSMWVADDNADRIYEINPVTGAYKAEINGSAFQAATQVGTGTLSDPTRSDDLESIVYNPDEGVLYVTSGNCCNVPAGQPPYHPTVYKLTKDVVGHVGQFWPKTWQALAEGQDPTAAGWRPGTGMYYGRGTKIKTYNFDSNSVGADISIPVATPGAEVVGIDFTDSSTAFITTAKKNTSSGRTTADSDSTIRRFDISGSSWTPNTTWTFGLQNTGMIDARDLAIIGDLFYVSDGYDSRTGGDHPIIVYTLGQAPPASPGGYIVDGQGGLHTYRSGNGPTPPAASGGPYWSYDIARGVAVLPNGTGGYVLDGQGGLHPFGIGGHAAPAGPVGGPYWSYDIARGVAFTADGKGGYVLDGQGGLHPFKVGNSGTAPAAPVGGPYWGYNIARGVAITGSGGYIGDGQGGLHPFKIGNSGTAPAAPVGGPYWGYDIARGVTVRGTGGYVGDGQGGTHGFKIGSGGTIPPSTTGGPYWGYDIARGIAALQ
jgi:Esterase-like activity of phytase